jgi:regulation of enolase protein 1 (concanavalin A-like superfamily)
VLTVRADAEHWAKLCLERSPTGDVAVVSVVTRTWSDDANGELISSQTSPAPACCYLRITRDGNRVGMHYSLDGQVWRFVRAVGLEFPETVKVGVHAQAPFGSGVSATFKVLALTDEPIKDFRSKVS